VGLLVILAASFAGAAFLWFRGHRTGSYSIIMCGGRSSRGNLGITSGNLFLVSGKPAVLYGTVTKPGAQEELSYVLVFRHALSARDFAGFGPPIDFGSFGEGWKHESRDAITISGKRIEAHYEVELNGTGATVAREALTVGGQSKDLTAGKVFLVDLATEAPAYTQKNLEQIPPVTPLGSPADVERFALAILQILENQDATTNALLR
jgi:hypothetical protein